MFVMWILGARYFIFTIVKNCSHPRTIWWDSLLYPKHLVEAGCSKKLKCPLTYTYCKAQVWIFWYLKNSLTFLNFLQGAKLTSLLLYEIYYINYTTFLTVTEKKRSYFSDFIFYLIQNRGQKDHHFYSCNFSALSGVLSTIETIRSSLVFLPQSQ